MPHSITPEDGPTASPENPENIVVENGDVQTPQETVPAGDSQMSDAMDHDMTIAEAGVQGQEIPEPVVMTEVKTEIKLEDLFADYESDEEFPSSNVNDLKITSSPPEAPLSPV